jgi:hypothetical protein
MYPNRDINGGSGSVGGGGGVDPDVITGIDLQLAALEVKTSNQTSTGQTTSFAGSLHADRWSFQCDRSLSVAFESYIQ